MYEYVPLFKVELKSGIPNVEKKDEEWNEYKNDLFSNLKFRLSNIVAS